MNTKQTLEDQYLQQDFDKIDKDKTGKISVVEFRQFAFDNEDLHLFRKATIDAYIAELSNNTQWITFEQFKEFMTADTHTFKNALMILELKQAFNEVDTDKNGLISLQEARRGITLAGQYISGPCFRRLVQLFDDDGDGQMSFNEFVKHITEILHE